jgi:hypothetical protein
MTVTILLGDDLRWNWYATNPTTIVALSPTTTIYAVSPLR